MGINLKKTLIYHITHVDNLPGILSAGGLWSDTEREQQDLPFVNIAHAGIKGRRRNIPVPVSEGGVVADYVPFYFCPRSPMLYVINMGGVEGYRGNQREVVHLCAHLAGAIEKTKWCAASGHAIMALSEFFSNKEDLLSFDWDAIWAKGWGYPYYTEDSDLERRKQAEFLVHRFFPWDLFLGIGVIDDSMRERAESLFADTEHKLPVKVKRKWYY